MTRLSLVRITLKQNFVSASLWCLFWNWFSTVTSENLTYLCITNKFSRVNKQVLRRKHKLGWSNFRPKLPQLGLAGLVAFKALSTTLYTSAETRKLILTLLWSSLLTLHERLPKNLIMIFFGICDDASKPVKYAATQELLFFGTSTDSLLTLMNDHQFTYLWLFHTTRRCPLRKYR